jgi:hypothetical protein
MQDAEPHLRTSLKQSALLSIKKLAKAQTSDVGMKDGKMHETELQRMTAGELDALFKQYNAACDKINPSIEQFSREEILGWIETLKKSSQEMEMTLIDLSSFQLAAIVRHLLTTGASPEGN